MDGLVEVCDLIPASEDGGRCETVICLEDGPSSLLPSDFADPASASLEDLPGLRASA